MGVGIGLNGGADNLRAVSGPTQNQDYFLSSNTGFGDILKQLATGACNNQLTITKQIQDPSGALISPTPADANGWTFANTISAGSTIASPATTGVVNGANGVAIGRGDHSGRCDSDADRDRDTEGRIHLRQRAMLRRGYCRYDQRDRHHCDVHRRSRAADGVHVHQQTTAADDRDHALGGRAGRHIHLDTATVTGGVTPTGTVTFQLFPPGEHDLHRRPRSSPPPTR